jgi:hypothetical protein
VNNVNHPPPFVDQGESDGLNLEIVLWAYEQKHILRVPPRHFRIAPDPGTDAVARHETVTLKQVHPVARPLLIDMVCAALTRNCRREDDYGRQRNQRSYKPRRALRQEVLRNFQAKTEIELSPEPERP